MYALESFRFPRLIKALKKQSKSNVARFQEDHCQAKEKFVQVQQIGMKEKMIGSVK